MAITALKNSLGIAVQFLNQPIIKKGVKNISSTAAFTFGIVETYDIYQILRGREIWTETHLDAPKWVQIATKIAIVCAKISLILGAATSRPGIFIISTLVGSVFSTGQLERAFGPNTIFAINPWHPRHIFSISAVILALPSLIQSTLRGIQWAHTKICQNVQGQSQSIEKEEFWLADTKVRMMILFNTIASRPVQHLGNQLSQVLTAV